MQGRTDDFLLLRRASILPESGKTATSIKMLAFDWK